MKKLFWNRIINDPDKPEKTVWKVIQEAKIDQKEIEELFCDNRMAPVKAADNSANTIAVSGPVIKQYFTPEESKSI